NAEIRIECDRFVITRDGVVDTANAMQGGATVEPVHRGSRVERNGAVKARYGFGMAAEFTQHIRAVAIGVGEIDVALQRLVGAFESFFQLSRPMQCLADEIVGARLPGPERQ